MLNIYCFTSNFQEEAKEESEIKGEFVISIPFFNIQYTHISLIEIKNIYKNIDFR